MAGTAAVFTRLKEFLPAGVITFCTDDPYCSSFTNDGPLADDGWRLFPQVVVGFRDDSGNLEKIAFLVRHRFIAATSYMDTSNAQLFLRIYIIPWDLPGSRGELRTRDDAVLKPGCKYLRQLFLKIRREHSLWEGSLASSSSPVYFLSNEPDNRTLLDIYNSLPSPSAPPIQEDIPGLRSRLYDYQRRSVATMVARETNPGSIEHPLYVPIQGIDGKLFYMQPATMEILSELPRVSAVPGGILCEELGTGKTIMILSLILATLDQLAAPEEGIYEERHPLTPLALKLFDTSAVISERAKLAGRRKTKADPDRHFPSLVEIMLHKCRVSPEGLPLRDPEIQERLEQQRLWKAIRANVPFYLHSQPAPEGAVGRRARTHVSNGPKVMFLTSATLIIVPDNLRRQWANEILKHCTDILRVLLVDDKRELPDAPVLATDFDIILMSHSRFSHESKKRNVESLYSWKVCECKPKPNALVRRCKCSRRKDVSPLLQIRWKRLVVDEGHNTAEKQTDYAIFTKLLSVERRWIVTGTPTTNLLGLNFGSGNELLYPEEDGGEKAPAEQRIWPAEEREDMRKLGNMLADFLLMMPFAYDSKTFKTLVADPLFRATGPYPGDIDVLVQVMSTVMVRHRIEDVESEVRLALLDNQIALLDMDPMAVKTYNIMQAIIAVNAVDSEREHQDYLFHPRNTSHLQELVSNISHTMFWHVSDGDHEERLSNAQSALKHLETGKRKGLPGDLELIKQAIIHIQAAKEDPVWVSIQSQYHVFYRIQKMHPLVYDAWCTFTECARKASPVALLPPHVLVQIRQAVVERPLSSIAKIAEIGQSFNELEKAYRDVARFHEQRKTKSSRDRHAASESKKMPSEVAKRASAKEKMEEMQREMEAALARFTSKFNGEDGDSPSPVNQDDPSQHMVASSLLRLSPLAGVRIRNSLSTKLDYILNEVLTYGTEEKFLIFSQSPSVLSFVAEALDLFKIKHLSFSGQHSREERQSMITTFETSELYRVLLLELKHGARGLNLVSASRVIFCEPVWKADVESQAIKRVHRIGQTRPVVHVTTLAIRSTFEEVMVTRSKALRENKQEVAKAATDDRTVRDFLAHPTFLPVPTEEGRVNFDRPLFDIPPPPSPVSRPTAAAPPHVQPVAEKPRSSGSAYVEIPSEPPRKKQKRVAFVD
ncbi:hypothetical protein GY45DRAFT_1369061 [Cubamyces sp. BRFM 1775]|nr:hypothetical protein GY45DRAFT_1369061 [Cubamyces sp. BRFM 1775]